MSTLTYAPPAILPGVSLALDGVVAGLRWLRTARIERRCAARRRAELDRLDPDALHDLGPIHREFDAFVADARDAASRTRLHVYDDPTGWWSR